MSMNDRLPDRLTPENMVSYSEQLLSFSIERLTLQLRTHTHFDAADGKDLTDEFRSLRKALEIAYHERAQLQKLKPGDGDGGSCLDLEAARAEIASRLARLRAAGGDGGVSKRTD